MGDIFSDVLDSVGKLADLLLNKQFFTHQALSDLMQNVQQNDRETKLKRIIENIETRDPEDIDQFAKLVRNSQLFNEQFFLREITSFDILNDELIVRFKDLLSSSESCDQFLTVTKAEKENTEYDVVYKMTSKPRGFCIIIDNQLFIHSILPFRAGSRADANRLSNVFSQLGFSVKRYVNRTADQMEGLLKQYSKNCELSNHDSLAVIILSHGNDDTIYSSDYREIKVESILNMFNNQNCRLLIGKPKMFFLNACRGNQIDSGTKIYTDHWGEGQVKTLSKQSTNVGSSIPTWSDMFVYFATVNGYASLRNVNTGSWFGYALAHAIAEYAHIEHLHDLVTVRVGQMLQQRESEDSGPVKKQAIESLAKGSVKKLYLNPGI